MLWSWFFYEFFYFFLRIFQVEITNDGATILKSIGVDNPAAKILVDMSRVQDDEVGDGTTSVTVFGKSLILLVLLIVENTLFHRLWLF